MQAWPRRGTCRKYKQICGFFVVAAVSREIIEHNVLSAIRQFMAVRGLALSEEKIRITHTDEDFDFLGQNVRKYGGKLLIKQALYATLND